MGKAIEKEAASIEEAIRAALSELGCEKEEATIDVLQQPTGGFLGFFAKPARVRVTAKEKEAAPQKQVAAPERIEHSEETKEQAAESNAPAAHARAAEEPRSEDSAPVRTFEDSRSSYEARLFETNEKAVTGPLADKAEKFLSDLFAAMKMDVTITRSASSDGVIFNLSGDNLGILIGKHGQTLDSLQYLANLAANRTHEGEHLHLILDIEDYRARRETTLMRLAGHLADKACSIGQEVHLEPMTRHERKIIHMALQSNRRVTSYSAGTEPRRYVVIVPKRRRRRDDDYYERGEY